jgi:hypothetical protein
LCNSNIFEATDLSLKIATEQYALLIISIYFSMLSSLSKAVYFLEVEKASLNIEIASIILFNEDVFDSMAAKY